MTAWIILAVLGGMLASALALAVLFRGSRRRVQWSFAIGMVVLAFESFFIAFSLMADAPDVVFWQKLIFLTIAFVPGPWLVFSLVFARDDYPTLNQRWIVAAICAFVLPATIASVGWNALVFPSPSHPSVEHRPTLCLGWAGEVLQVVLVIASVGILTNLERTFRASVGTIRWKIKFMLVGLGVLFVVRIYSSSQLLLYYNEIQASLLLSLWELAAVTLPIACLLITRSLAREGALNVTVYPSRALLQHSVTAVAAGAYLLLVGLFAKVVTVLGGAAAFPVKALFVLVALVGLTVLLVSDRINQWTRLFVSRHFKRPLHDYHKVWHSVTERTASMLSATDLCRAVAHLLSETFQILSVTVWLIDERKGRLVFAASTSLTEDKARLLSHVGGDISALRKVFSAQPYPVDIDQSKEEWVEELRRCNPDQFSENKQRICVPLVAGGNLVGLIALSDRVGGARFTIQDLDVLKCIGEQVAASLLNIELSQKLLHARELEAFQTMSAFFVHDLKNTASTLSLTLQNLPNHFEDPAFRADALQSVGKSVDRINALIARVGLLRQTLTMNLKDTDLNEVIDSAVSGLETVRYTALSREFSPLPKIRIDPEQIQKVVTNLVLNAWDAVEANPSAEVALKTTRQNGWVILSVCDNGCGMSSEFVNNSLFRPFQTTKKKGVGIGMFHSRAIVEAHRGKIEVTSEVGQGTTFRVLLPCEEKKA